MLHSRALKYSYYSYIAMAPIPNDTVALLATTVK